MMLMLSQGDSLIANFKALRLFYWVEDIKAASKEMLSLEFASLIAERNLYKSPGLNEYIRFIGPSNLSTKLH